MAPIPDQDSDAAFDAYVGAKCEQDLRAALTNLARRNDRTLAAEVRRALRAHVERESQVDRGEAVAAS